MSQHINSHNGTLARAGLSLTALSMALVSIPAVAQAKADSGDSMEEGTSGNTIVVTAAGFEQKVTDAPASISVIDREALEEKRYGSLAEALDDVEGVDIGATAGKTGGLNISIRGMPSEYTLVLIDGRRQNAPGNVTPNGFGETSTSFIPPYSAIDRIEVVRGPMSTLYGSDAMGGVINIITRKVGDRWVGTATTEVTVQENSEFGNRYAANGFAQGPLIPDLVGLSVRGSYFHRNAANLEFKDVNGDPVPVNQRGPSPVKSDVYTLGGRLTIAPHPDHDIWIEADIARQKYDNVGGQLGTLDVPGANRGYGPELKFNRDNYALAHSWRAGFANIDTTLTRSVTETLGRTIPNNSPGLVAGDPRTLNAKNTVLDSRAIIPIASHTVTIGGQYWWARMTDGIAAEKFSFDQWALFGESEIVLHDKFRVTLGGRYDDHTIFGSKFSPRAYAVLSLTDSVTLKGGVSRGFKTPRLDQITPGITGFTGQGTIPVIGTPTLKPETSTSYEAGLYYNNGGFFSGNATFFYNDFKDKIASGPDVPNCTYDPLGTGAQNLPGCIDVGNFPAIDVFGQTVNVDKAVTQGAEIAMRFNVTPAISLYANYTYTDSEQKSGPDQGLPLIGTPKHMANANLRWKLSNQFTTWVRGEFRSSRFRGTGRTATPEQAALGNYKGYTQLHLGANLDVTENFRLSGTIYNLLGKNFVRYLPYDSGASYGQEYANLIEPRRFWLSASIDF